MKISDNKSLAWPVLIVAAVASGCGGGDEPDNIKPEVERPASTAIAPSNEPKVDDRTLATDTPDKVSAGSPSNEIASIRFATDSKAISSLPEGGYELVVLPAEIDLLAHAADPVRILEDLAKRLSFDLSVGASVSGTVSVDTEAAPLALVLFSLLREIEYTAEYAEEADELGFHLRSVSIGPRTIEYPDDAAEPQSRLATSTLVPDVPVNLGSVPRRMDLAERLFQSEDPQVRALAVRELRMDPSGFNAAVQVYKNDSDPEVRHAALRLLSSEDYFVAKQVLVDALSDPHVPTVLHALKSIETQHDFSVVPLLETLYSHEDASVQSQARQAVESLMSAYIHPDDLTPIDPTRERRPDARKP